MTRQRAVRRDPVGTLVERWDGEEALARAIRRFFGKQVGDLALEPHEEMSGARLTQLTGRSVGELRRRLSILLWDDAGPEPASAPAKANVILTELVMAFFQRLGEEEYSGRICTFCWGSMTISPTRPRIYCSNRCRQAAWRRNNGKLKERHSSPTTWQQVYDDWDRAWPSSYTDVAGQADKA